MASSAHGPRASVDVESEDRDEIEKEIACLGELILALGGKTSSDPGKVWMLRYRRGSIPAWFSNSIHEHRTHNELKVFSTSEQI